MSAWQTVIGLEVHVQLLTRSKLFSSASTAFGGEPNSHVALVCLGLPGTLPVLNAQVVDFAVRTGLGLECRVNRVSEWSRKHYFYPDLPKGYQITQYDRPICEHGKLTFDVEGVAKSARVRRIHIEEDAGKLVHEAGQSLVDLNRAGTPLLEIVSEPDLSSADEAVEYLKALRDLVVWLGVNDGNLEEGSFRCDANVSVRKPGEPLGTRCELKNLNSFRNIKLAIECEARRHIELRESNVPIEQETRLFDVQRGETRAMRSKEDAHDYRYFPEPDLPLLVVEPEVVERHRAELPELPRAMRARFEATLGLPAYDTQVLTADRAMATLFEACLRVLGDAQAKRLSNWFMGELSRLCNEAKLGPDAVKFTPAQLGALFKAIDDGVVSASAAKEVFAEMFKSGAEPGEVIQARGLAQVSDTSAIDAAVEQVLVKNAESADSYRAGKKQLWGFFVGQVMKAMKGKANPTLVNAALAKKLGAP